MSKMGLAAGLHGLSQGINTGLSFASQILDMRDAADRRRRRQEEEDLEKNAPTYVEPTLGDGESLTDERRYASMADYHDQLAGYFEEKGKPDRALRAREQGLEYRQRAKTSTDDSRRETFTRDISGPLAAGDYGSAARIAGERGYGEDAAKYRELAEKRRVDAPKVWASIGFGAYTSAALGDTDSALETFNNRLAKGVDNAERVEFNPNDASVTFFYPESAKKQPVTLTAEMAEAMGRAAGIPWVGEGGMDKDQRNFLTSQLRGLEVNISNLDAAIRREPDPRKREALVVEKNELVREYNAMGADIGRGLKVQGRTMKPTPELYERNQQTVRGLDPRMEVDRRGRIGSSMRYAIDRETGEVTSTPVKTGLIGPDGQYDELPTELRAMLGRGEVRAGGGRGLEVVRAKGKEDVPTPTTDQEFEQLPSGALYRDPDDGKLYRKP